MSKERTIRIIKFKFSVPYKINLLGFTKSPNNDFNVSIIP